MSSEALSRVLREDAAVVARAIGTTFFGGSGYFKTGSILVDSEEDARREEMFSESTIPDSEENSSELFFGEGRLPDDDYIDTEN